jgi:NDP-sugar pyrophosphorylase family protein
MTMTYDFGSGPVPAHKHVNGGGWVADTACVGGHAYVGSNARVGGHAWVGDHARVGGHARVGDQARVRSVCLRTPIYIAGGEYSVTICDEQIHIGCQDGTVSFWASVVDDKYPILMAMKDAILEIARHHQRSTR